MRESVDEHIETAITLLPEAHRVYMARLVLAGWKFDYVPIWESAPHQNINREWQCSEPSGGRSPWHQIRRPTLLQILDEIKASPISFGGVQ